MEASSTIRTQSSEVSTEVLALPRSQWFGSEVSGQPKQSEPFLRGVADCPSPSSAAFAERRKRALEELQRRGVDAALFAAGWARPRNFAHNVYPFRAESHFLHLVGHHIEGACLLLAGGEATLFVVPPDPEMELWMGRGKSPEEWGEELGMETRPMRTWVPIDGCACLPPQDDETAGFLGDLLGRTIVAQSGGELSGVDAATADAMVALRLTHDETALEQIRFATRISAFAHERAMRLTPRLAAESEVRGLMEGVLTAHGSGPAYNSIVTTGGHVLHAERSPNPLCDGELLLCDLGAESPLGYAADITRTWPVSGRFSPTQRDVYQLVYSVQERAIEGARVGRRFADLHLDALSDMARGLVDLGIARCSKETCLESGLASVFFPHGLGHLLGLDVHDMEDLGDRAGYGDQGERSAHPAFSTLRLFRKLEEEMVVTIEPGFYQVPFLLRRARSHKLLAQLVDWGRLEQFADVKGIRIEDDVRIGRSGPEVLSSSAPKHAADIEELMRHEVS